MQHLPQQSKDTTLLKICGITLAADAERLVELKVDAIGLNFWPESKRYISAQKVASFSALLKGKILRVGVFVNASQEDILKLLKDDIIDVAQLHGDEDITYCQQFSKHGFSFIKAIGVKDINSLKDLPLYKASAILLDAHAPKAYGGTGDTFDWNLAKKVMLQNPEIPIILAGGITTDNAALAVAQVRPCALDIASGAEISPGIKDFDKIIAIQNALE